MSAWWEGFYIGVMTVLMPSMMLLIIMLMAVPADDENDNRGN